MEKRICAKCKVEFQPDFANQKNCLRCKEYNQNRKQESRQREREEQLAKRIPNANGFEMPIAKQAELDKHASEILKTVRAELPEHRFVLQDEFVIETAAETLFGLENNWKQQVVVEQSIAMLVGGHFPDAVANIAIEHVHRFPNLLGSATLKSLYEKFLQAVVKWDGKYQHAYSSSELMADVRAELAGNYILTTPAVPVPATPPAPVEVSTVQPSEAEIERNVLARSRMRLTQQLYGIPADAIQYLEQGR